jgi:hypothetical protein
MRVIFLMHFNLRDTITVLILYEEQKLSTSSCNSLNSPIISYLLGVNVLLSALFSHILYVYSLLEWKVKWSICTNERQLSIANWKVKLNICTNDRQLSIANWKVKLNIFTNERQLSIANWKVKLNICTNERQLSIANWNLGLSQLPRGLRYKLSLPAQKLGSGVRIPVET